MIEVEEVNSYKFHLSVLFERKKTLTALVADNEKALIRNVFYGSGIVVCTIGAFLHSLIMSWSYFDVVVQAALIAGVRVLYINHKTLKRLTTEMRDETLPEINSQIRLHSQFITDKDR